MGSEAALEGEHVRVWRTVSKHLASGCGSQFVLGCMQQPTVTLKHGGALSAQGAPEGAAAFIEAPPAD